jgi:hypothetical protein
VAISVTLRLDELFSQGKDFKWERPCACPKCQGKIWGHGFVSRYFQGFSSALWIKRFRCTACRAVIAFRPSDYWPRLQTSAEAIFRALLGRLESHCWPQGVSRQRAGHWLAGFLRSLRLHPEWGSRGEDLPAQLAAARASGLRFI